jgi:hypothetical protein
MIMNRKIQVFLFINLVNYKIQIVKLVKIITVSFYFAVCDGVGEV